MELERLTIGQMAKINSVSVQTLRLYDREGLLKPYIVDDSTGYRYYHINQSARLDMIQYMKAYRMTLHQIKEHLERCNMEEIICFLKKRYETIDQEIETLKHNKRVIGKTIENYQKYEHLPKNNQIFMEYIGERHIYKYTSEKNFFDQDDAGYEYMLRELKQHLLYKKLPMTYFRNVGTIMRKNNIVSGRFVANEVFVFVENDCNDPGNIERIPTNMYIAMCSRDFHKEIEYAGRLLKEIEQRELEIVGDYICEVITEFPVFQEYTRDIFYKIQIPVKSK